MRPLILAATVAASAIVATPSGAMSPPPPDTQADTDLIQVACDVTNQQTSSNCRFEVGIEDATARLKAGSVLGYLDAHPVPVPGGAAGTTVETLIRLRVAPGKGQGYEVTAPEDLLSAASGPELSDPVWIVSPLDPWATWYAPMRAVRMGVKGTATVNCKATSKGALLDCWLKDEHPKDFGFGPAALKLLTRARMETLSSSGQAVAGRPFSITLQFDPNALTRVCHDEGALRACNFEPTAAVSNSPTARNTTDLGLAERPDVAVTAAMDPANGPPIRKPAFRANDEAARYFPERAQRMAQSGLAVIQCAMALKGTLSNCTALAEAPADFGFGEGTMRMVSSGVLSAKPEPADQDGQTVRVIVAFRVPTGRLDPPGYYRPNRPYNEGVNGPEHDRGDGVRATMPRP